MKKLFPFALLSMLAGVAGCHQSNPPAPAGRVIFAQTFVVEATSRNQPVLVAGVVKPHLEADLEAQIVAPVAVVTKHMGDHFRRGEVLVRLHAPALDAGVAQANAALRSAQQQEGAAATQAALASATLHRYAELHERQSVTPYELDQIKAQEATALAQQQSAAAQVSAAQSALSIQRANAADMTLYAPFDGVVTSRLVDPGAMAAPGVPLLHLQSTGADDVVFSAPEPLLNLLHIGDSIPVSLDPTSPIPASIAVGSQNNAQMAAKVAARIATIAPAGDADSHSFLVKATLPNASSLPKASGWPVGTVVQVSLPSRQITAGILIPSSSVIQQGGLNAVLAIGADGRAAVRYIVLGGTVGDRSVVLTGLRPGDRVLTVGDLTLAGARIEAQP